MRQHAYRLTGSILDADDIVQDTMLRAIEMGPALENIEDHSEWLYTACTEAALSRLREKKPLEVNEFDLPDLIQTRDSSTNGETKSIEADAVWPSVALEFLFPLQYMTPEQRAVVVLRDGVEDGDRIAASVMGVTIQEVFKLLIMQIKNERKFISTGKRISSLNPPMKKKKQSAYSSGLWRRSVFATKYCCKDSCRRV